MTWVKIDDQLAVHVKVVDAGNAAMGLWIRAAAWCSGQLTDGRVPAALVRTLDGTPADAQRLVKAGLWIKEDDGYRFHDWHDYQPSRAQVLAERAAGRERVAKSRARKQERRTFTETHAERAAQERRTFTETHDERSATPSPSPSPDCHPPIKSQSPDTRASGETDAEEATGITGRIAGQLGLRNLDTIAEAIAAHTGRVVSPASVVAVARALLDKARQWPDSPQSYVLACINASALEVQQLIDELGLDQ